MFENFRWFRGLALPDELAELAENLENFVLSTDKRLAIFLSLKSVKLNQYCFLQQRSCDTRIDFYHLFIYLPLTKNVLHSFKQKKKLIKVNMIKIFWIFLYCTWKSNIQNHSCILKI